jgi:SAM-dependent methyltransferase
MARPAYEAVLERTNIGRDTCYLDVGCGSGMAAQLAAARGARVSGIDAAEALLTIAPSRVPGGDFHHADIEDLPFSDQTFDVVTGFNSFQYAANPVASDAAQPIDRDAGARQQRMGVLAAKRPLRYAEERNSGRLPVWRRRL